MPVFSFLYSIIISPLELLFEQIYMVAVRVIKDPGLTIIALSLAMNFLVLPLYQRADAMQEEERRTEEKMRPWIDHIKKTFKGNERWMIMQTYYRQNDYHPMDALKGAVPLLLEIPFFIAAYHFLSNLSMLKGVSFGPIRDLGAPDAMLVVAGTTINVLPLLMTGINLVAGAIYTKGLSLKSKIQLYGMACIFLVFLYDSPSGLVFYWTCNNIFSLVKNIFYKLKNPRKKLGIISCLCGLVVLAVGIIYPRANPKHEFFIICMGLLLQIPALLYKYQKGTTSSEPDKDGATSRESDFIFFGGVVFLTILTGLLIPSGVIQSSPAEFINIKHFQNPVGYIIHSMEIAIGTFIVWGGIFYSLATRTGRKVIALIVWIASLAAVMNYMFFGRNLGTILNTLQFELYPHHEILEVVINLLAIIVLAIAGMFIYKKKKNLARGALIISTLALCVMGFVNIHDINEKVAELRIQSENARKETVSIPLSKKGKNVIVMMLDRAIAQQVPYIMNEKPELKEIFSGFTYYPNTISYGGHTNVGAPVLFGGYDYTPVKMNERDQESLESKHNEALKVMPVLFSQNGFQVGVCDTPYAGYSVYPDLSIYNDHPEINTYIAEYDGKFNEWDSYELTERIYKRNFFCYSIFKIAPLILQESIYNNGRYNMAKDKLEIDMSGQVMDGNSKASGIKSIFMNSYSVLQNLPVITDVRNDNSNTFFMMANNTTHESMLLKEPEYEPALTIDNTEYDASHTECFTINGRTMHMDKDYQVTHYHVNMAAFIQVGRWLEYLKNEGVYENTKIIIVSDHGFELGQFDDFHMLEDTDAMRFNSLLMVKDFGDGKFETSEEFMTIGDVPALSTKDVIENPVNPFTNSDLSNMEAKKGKQMILETDWRTDVNNGNRFGGGVWYSIHDNIFDKNNWKREGENP